MNLFIRRFFAIACLIIISAGFSEAQKLKTDGYEITPEDLKAGGSVSVRINPEKCTPLVKDKPVYAVMLAYTFGKMKGYDALMKSVKGTLTATFTIPETADVVAFKFMQGNEAFSNNGHGIKYNVNDRDGKFQNSSLYSMYRLQMNDYNAGITKGKAEVAEKLFNKWYEKGEFSNVSFFDMAVVYHRKKDTIALRNHLSKIGPAGNLTELQLTNILSRYAPACGKETRALVESDRKRRFPDGEWYWKKWRDTMMRLQTPAEKMAWIKAFMLAFPEEVEKGNPVLYNMHKDLLYSQSRGLDMKAFHMASAFIDKKPEQFARSFYDYNNVLNQSLSKDTLVNEFLPIAKNIMHRIHSMVAEDINRDPDLSPQMHYLDRYRYYVASTSTYSAFLTKTGAYDSAVFYARKTADFYNWMNPFHNERYFNAAIHVKPAAEVLEELKTVFRQNTYTPAMKPMFLQLCERSGITNGSELMAAVMNERKNKIMQDLRKSALADSSPDFKLPGLNGGEVSLSSLKGKVVLLDFWATWCGPCVASFPAMQKLVDNNKDRKDVAIFFVDTWQTEADKFALVKKFLSDKNYRFDVLMDITDEVVKSFNISGIPTKIIIDKKGTIRFESLGFNGDEEKAIDELQAMIDVASEY